MLLQLREPCNLGVSPCGRQGSTSPCIPPHHPHQRGAVTVCGRLLCLPIILASETSPHTATFSFCLLSPGLRYEGRCWKWHPLGPAEYGNTPAEVHEVRHSALAAVSSVRKNAGCLDSAAGLVPRHQIVPSVHDSHFPTTLQTGDSPGTQPSDLSSPPLLKHLWLLSGLNPTIFSSVGGLHVPWFCSIIMKSFHLN